MNISPAEIRNRFVNSVFYADIYCATFLVRFHVYVGFLKMRRMTAKIVGYVVQIIYLYIYVDKTILRLKVEGNSE